MAGDSKEANEPTGGDDPGDSHAVEAVTSGPSSPSTAQLCDLLADNRRRYALQYLLENETPIAVADLADEVAARESDISVRAISAEEARRIHSSLWHSHVPKLLDAGIVDCNRDRRTVTLAENDEQLESYLRRVTAE